MNCQCPPLPPTTDQIAPCSAWERAELSTKTWQAIFPPQQRTIAHVKNGLKLLEDTQLGGGTPCRLFTRPGPFRIPPVFVHGPRVCWAALRVLRKRQKMAWWVVYLEREGTFLKWYPQIDREIFSLWVNQNFPIFCRDLTRQTVDKTSKYYFFSNF